MAYNFLSNISNFDSINIPDKAYEQVMVNQEIKFLDNDIPRTASFIMIRAHEDNDLLIQLLPWNYGVYIPANEMWSAESLDEAEGIVIKKIFAKPTLGEASIGKIQWMIGYK